MRYYVTFRSSFRSESTPCISHETVDRKRTLCGRSVDSAETIEPDSNDLEPDCITCSRVRRRLKATVEEAPIACETCVNGHPIGVLRRPCGVRGCECWCNR